MIREGEGDLPLAGDEVIEVPVHWLHRLGLVFWAVKPLDQEEHITKTITTYRNSSSPKQQRQTFYTHICIYMHLHAAMHVEERIYILSIDIYIYIIYRYIYYL